MFSPFLSSIVAVAGVIIIIIIFAVRRGASDSLLQLSAFIAASIPAHKILNR